MKTLRRLLCCVGLHSWTVIDLTPSDRGWVWVDKCRRCGSLRSFEDVRP